MIEEFVELIPESLLRESGEVFYSGRLAFSGSPELYILGANPGSDPLTAELNTIKMNIDLILKKVPELWSSYTDQNWGSRAVGSAPMQRRLQHLATKTGLDLRRLPSSNLVFPRSRRTANLDRPFAELVDLCWPFHRAVVERLKPRAVLCLGVKTGHNVLAQLGGGWEIDHFVENNERRWRSVVWRANSGQTVIGLSHPGIANWVSSATDPSPLVLRAMSA